MRFTGWDDHGVGTLAPRGAAPSRPVVGWKLAAVRPDSEVMPLNGSRLRSSLVARPRPAGQICGVSYHAELRPTTRQVLRHLVDPGSAVVARSRLTGGRSVDEVEAAGAVETAWSMESAIAAAASHLERPVTETGQGARVEATRIDISVVCPGDVVTAVDGRTVATASDLQTLLAGRADAVLTVRRPDGASVGCRLARSADGDWGIRVVTDGRRLHHSLAVSFRLPDDLRGPSLGLACALAVVDAFTGGTLAAGGDVVATGTLDLAGRVGAVGGVLYKARTVRTLGNIRRFLVPAGSQEDVDDARRILGGRTQVVAVSSLAEAVQILREAC